MAMNNGRDDLSIKDFQLRQSIISTLKKRFSTYGYQQIRTPIFESYDLYTSTNGTVNHHNMIKAIDNKGRVLVLRPDITIPITRQIAMNENKITNDLRYFYVLDVFRQSFDDAEGKEKTQAGVEYFGKNNIAADAEVIALAVHVLKDFQFEHFKIELGHAGFLKQLISKLGLKRHDLKQLKQLLQAKNVIELRPFLTHLQVDQQMIEKIEMIPELYGEPAEVIERAKKIVLNKQMEEKLYRLLDLYKHLKEYNVENHLVLDLGLINHMDYYSGIVFQGFVNTIGKPILMGGRYDQLANQFNASIPAIGFACDVETLLQGTQQQIEPATFVDIIINYEKTERKYAIRLTTELRELQYNVLTYCNKTIQTNNKANFIVNITTNRMVFIHKQNKYPFQNKNELLQLLQRNEGKQ